MGVGQLLFIIRISLTRDSLTGGEYELPEKACEAEFYYYARNVGTILVETLRTISGLVKATSKNIDR